jgi:hypothetical protein
MGIDPELAYDIFVETGIDVLVWQADKNIGNKICTAAFNRHSAFPGLLKEVYAPRFESLLGIPILEAEAFIGFSEGTFQQAMLAYGLALNPSETKEKVVKALSMLLASQAIRIQEQKDISAASPEELAALIEAYVKLSVAICSSPLTPAMREINSTIFGLRYLSPLFLYSRY